jgi:hypothetical protein
LGKVAEGTKEGLDSHPKPSRGLRLVLRRVGRILGGLLIMMGQHARSEALFYYFRLEDQVPENHLLRLIDQHFRLALCTND